MPRLPRISLPGVPMHVVQRGINRRPCFRDHKDFLAYLDALGDSSGRYQVDVHAYVLMTNHVHLLVTPGTPDGASRMMQQLGRRYVQYFNRAHNRTGTLWEGRFKSSLILSDRYLLACYRYIELNPVRAGIVSSADHYPWSSFRANGLGHMNPLLRPHSLWLELGISAEARRSAYLRLFSHSEGVASDDMIRAAVRRNSPIE